MKRLLFLTAAALALFTVAASAQAIYVTPGYVMPGYIAPGYLAPTYGYMVPAPAYAVPAPSVVVPGYAPAPLYDYAPAYGTYTVTAPRWDWDW